MEFKSETTRVKILSCRRERILFVIASLEAGGAERVLVTLLKYLDRQKFQPSLAVLKKRGTFLTEIPSDITIYDLQRGKYWNTMTPIFHLMNIFRREEIDLVVTLLFPANLTSILAKRLSATKAKLVVCEHSAYLRGIQGERFKLLRKAILRCLNHRADRILAISREIQQILERDYKIPPDKIKVIYNPMDIERIKKMSRESLSHPWFQGDVPVIMGAGRLIEAKGFAYLLKAFAIVNKNIPARLLILGDGPEKERLESLAMDLDIETDISFQGFQENPFKFMARTTIFVLPSIFEGFPMVMLEAMACGTPVIATRCKSGPEEIIKDGNSGILVPVADEQFLANAIIRLLKDASLQKKIAKEGELRVQDFAAEKIVKEYQYLFEEVISYRTKKKTQSQ